MWVSLRPTPCATPSTVDTVLDVGLRSGFLEHLIGDVARHDAVPTERDLKRYLGAEHSGHNPIIHRG